MHGRPRVAPAARFVREANHLGFEIGLPVAPPRVRRAMMLTTHVLVMAFGAMAWHGWRLAMGTWGARMAGAGLPQGVDYLALVGGGALVALLSLERILVDLTEPPADPLAARPILD